MIVVSNTSPLTNLAAIGQFDLLKKLYDSIYIAEGVWLELNAKDQSWPGSNEVEHASWVKRKEIKNQIVVTALREDLDRGESETIALAIEQKANLVLMDETEGRHKAKRLGLKVIGVIGILLEAKSKGHFSQIQPFLDKLRQEAGFYMSKHVYNEVLSLADETK
jgi:predicted nucleic acid-binding protein